MRRVFLVTADDEYLLGAVDDILSDEDLDATIENSVLGADANSVVRGIVEEMIFGDFACINGEQRVSIVIS